MRKIHLICNAHIDPVWQWCWQEGASSAISTFNSAVELCEEFDYIFCHGEVTLYKFIEEYAPQLFIKIKKLIKDGKWRIMGGWYLQPDCNMPSGESFVRQILLGKKYFKEKFDVEPDVAINFDSFGHSRGLVQIINKCGQTGYMICRPKFNQLILDKDQFYWEGYDGSTIKVDRTRTYNSQLGKAVENIKTKISQTEGDTICALWGVGNHGGGPSRKDLTELKQFIKESEDKIIHSYPELFFSEMEPKVTVSQSLIPCMPGCYSSLSKIKRKHIELENELYSTEKLCSISDMCGVSKYPHEQLIKVEEDLLNAEFHDILPGTVTHSGEESSLGYLYHGLQECENIKMKAFYSLISGQKKAEPETIPIFVFNYKPYELEENIACEFMLPDQNWEDDVSHFIVKDEQGNILTHQVIKEESNINLDWRKKIVFAAKLKPLSINRFTVKIYLAPNDYIIEKDKFVYSDENKHVEIDKATGLLKSFKYKGKELIKNGFNPIVCDDNEDPWAMQDFQAKQLGDNQENFKCKANGIFGDLKSVQVIEDGKIYLGIECFFEKDNSKLRVEYDIYKNKPYIDVKVDAFWQDKNKILKLEIPVNIKGNFIGQQPFGKEVLYSDGRECVAQRFVSIKGEKGCLAIANNCTYGCSYKDNKIYISLLRGVSYCTHPIPDTTVVMIADILGKTRELIPSDKFVKKADIGEHNFAFRLGYVEENQLEKFADEFNEKPYALSVFPLGGEFFASNLVEIDNSNISLKAFKKSDTSGGYVFRLFNNDCNETECKFMCKNSTIQLKFGKYEVKTIVYDGVLQESKKMLI